MLSLSLPCGKKQVGRHSDIVEAGLATSGACYETIGIQLKTMVGRALRATAHIVEYKRRSAEVSSAVGLKVDYCIPWCPTERNFLN